MTTRIQLPADLAPSLAEKALALLAELSPAVHPPFQRRDVTFHAPLCVVCHRSGKVGGHHGA